MTDHRGILLSVFKHWNYQFNNREHLGEVTHVSATKKNEKEFKLSCQKRPINKPSSVAMAHLESNSFGVDIFFLALIFDSTALSHRHDVALTGVVGNLPGPGIPKQLKVLFIELVQLGYLRVRQQTDIISFNGFCVNRLNIPVREESLWICHIKNSF